MRPDGYLAEGGVAFGVGGFFIRPCGGSLAGNDRNLMVAAGGLDHMGQGAQHIFLSQHLDQRPFELVRYQVASLWIGPFF